MPLVAHIDLPTFQRLREEGEEILAPDRASHQDIREMHIGLLNMMPMPHWRRQKDNFFDWWVPVIKSFNSMFILLPYRV